jgi:hypothetical protein
VPVFFGKESCFEMMADGTESFGDILFLAGSIMNVLSICILAGRDAGKLAVGNLVFTSIWLLDAIVRVFGDVCWCWCCEDDNDGSEGEDNIDNAISVALCSAAAAAASDTQHLGRVTNFSKRKKKMHRRIEKRHQHQKLFVPKAALVQMALAQHAGQQHIAWGLKTRMTVISKDEREHAWFAICRSQVTKKLHTDKKRLLWLSRHLQSHARSRLEPPHWLVNAPKSQSNIKQSTASSSAQTKTKAVVDSAVSDLGPLLTFRLAEQWVSRHL